MASRLHELRINKAPDQIMVPALTDFSLHRPNMRDEFPVRADNIDFNGNSFIGSPIEFARDPKVGVDSRETGRVDCIKEAN